MTEVGLEYFQDAWRARAHIADQIMASETSLSRVLARLVAFEAQHTLWVTEDGRLQFAEKPRQDPIDRLETPVAMVSCGGDCRGFAFTRTDIGGLIASLAVDCDSVVELGSGYGLRLFEAWLAGAPKDALYQGIEPTASGRAMASKLAGLEPGIRFVSVAGDHATFDPSSLGGQRTLFVSCFSLMYVSAVTLDLFRRIAAIPGEVTCLFIEPFGFQISGDDDRARGQKATVAANRSNFNFFSVFNQAVGEGLFEPLFIGRDLFGRQDDNYTLGSVFVAAKVIGSAGE